MMELKLTARQTTVLQEAIASANAAQARFQVALAMLPETVPPNAQLDVVGQRLTWPDPEPEETPEVA